jgi:D-cysteine desulfhydrase family pyridoxal phosphate-dependent enzyme
MLLISHANVDVAPPMIDLGRFPLVPLATLPTPIEPAPRLSRELGHEVVVKRDDLTGLGLGGNKVRKLEFLLGAAVADGADTIVTFGALQSNHARQTAAACARLGLACELVLTRAVDRHGPAFEEGGNVALDHLFGATVTVVDNDEDEMAAAVAAVEGRIDGRAAWIPPGGSSAVGTLGYVAAGTELAGQLLERGSTPDDVVVAVSTGGTYAGLLTGLRLGGCPARVRGVCVYRPADRTREAVERLLADTAELLGVPPVPSSEVLLDDSFLGDGYGLPTAGMVDALALVARAEGIALDPVYTGKAADALISWARSGSFGPEASVVFVHTGGAPGLSAYPELAPLRPDRR